MAAPLLTPWLCNNTGSLVISGEFAKNPITSPLLKVLTGLVPRTGHMFRFSHPGPYSKAVAAFLSKALEGRVTDEQRLPVADCP